MDKPLGCRYFEDSCWWDRHIWDDPLHVVSVVREFGHANGIITDYGKRADLRHLSLVLRYLDSYLTMCSDLSYILDHDTIAILKAHFEQLHNPLVS